jgi:hypothetical protein
MAAATAILATTAIVSAGASVIGGIEANRQARKQARLVKEETKEAVGLKQEQIDQAVGSQQSAIAASGVDLDATSSIEILEETRLQGLKEIQSIKRFGAQRASEIRSQGRQALFGGVASAIGTLGQAYGQNAMAGAQGFRAGPSASAGTVSGGSYLNTGVIA